jgi:4-hydroxy-3-methylbut-2-enyl diphosphate reductase
MKIYHIEPHSYCEGVLKAFITARKAKKEHPDSPIHLLGSLVHNDEAVEELTSEGFILIDERKNDLEKALKELPEHSVVVFSAHGHPTCFDEIAKEKGFITYDATCHYVSSNLEMAASFVEKGHDIIYLGEKGHLEAISLCSISSHVHLLDNQSLETFDWKAINDPSPIFLSQTTMAGEEVRTASKLVLEHFPASFLLDGRCPSTKKRQQEITLAPSQIDLFIILGSNYSNNTMKLVHLAKESHPDARIILASDLAALKKFDLKRNHYCALASGASTSPNVYATVAAYLEAL